MKQLKNKPLTSHLAVSGFGQLASFRSLRSLHYASRPKLPPQVRFRYAVTVIYLM